MSSPAVSSRVISHTPKARSIGSHSFSHNMRFTPTTPMSPPIHCDAIDALLSPSRLPATDSMSYFPPFETMGSGPSEPEAGPSRIKYEDKENRHHVKGKSLGSLAGLMSLLSPGISPRKGDYSAPQPSRSSSDGDVLQALAKRVTPGKRRVLEPMTCLPNRVEEEVNIRHRRRRTSSDIDRIRRSPRKRETEGEIEEDGSTMIPYKARRRTRPVLNMTLPALPSWRFPMPSPPITSLSPDIPLSAFSPIDNPASNPSSTDSSPAKPLTPSSLCFDYTYSDINDEEILNDDLSPTTSTYGTLSSGPSRPITPRDICTWQREGTSPKSFDLHSNTSMYRSKLERTVSQASCDSKETIRPSQCGFVSSSVSDGEVTPKAGKAWM